MKKYLPNPDRIQLVAEDYDSLPDLCDGGLSAGAIAAIGAGVSAAGGIGTAAINAGARWGSSTYMRVAKEMARYNQQMSEDMYNKYQSPAAMMQQYKEAGLNPYLVYGNAQPGSPAAGQVSTNPSDYHDESAPWSQAVQALGNSVLNYQQIVSQEQANTNAKITQDILAANARMAEAKAEMAEFKAQHQQERYDVEKSILDSKDKRDALDLTIQMRYKEQEVISKLEKERQEVQSMKIGDREREARIKEIDQKIDESKAQVKYLEGQGQYLKWQMEMGEKRYSFDVANAQNANYWRGQEYNLKVRQQDAKEKYQDDSLKFQKRALGYKMYQDTRNFMYQLGKDKEAQKDKYYFYNLNTLNKANPINFLGAAAKTL